MDYKIIYVREENVITATTKLEKRVRQFIDTGWRPQGGVSATISDSAMYEKAVIMTQAMIKE